MSKAAERSEEAQGGTSASRPRGRPSLDTAVQIDREILDAALDQFLTHGYGQTSMAMIIKAAGVSKTTLYARYATKADLFRAIVGRTVQQIHNDTLQPGKELTHDLVDGLNAFGTSAIRISMSSLWSNYERLVYSEGPRFPELSHSITDRIHITIDTVARFILDAAERDGIPCRDAHAVARIFIMALRGIYSEMILSVREPGPEEITAFVSELVQTLVWGRERW